SVTDSPRPAVGGLISATMRSRSVTSTVSPRATSRMYSLSLFFSTLRPTARTAFKVASGSYRGQVAGTAPRPAHRVDTLARVALKERVHAAVHLHHEGPPQDPPAGEGDPEGHLALVLRRREDRRAGPQRRRQEHVAAGDGRGGARLRGRGVPRRGRDR